MKVMPTQAPPFDFSSQGEAGVAPGPFAGGVATDTWKSGVKSSYGYTVPRRFLWFLDFLVQAFAVFAAQRVAPLIQSLARPNGPLRVHWLAWLYVPDAIAKWRFPPFNELVWIPLVMVPSTLLFMQLLGGYRPLLGQSRTRLLISSFGAPFLGLSVVTVLVTSLRVERASRVFLYSSMALSAVGFLGYRVAVRAYKRYRLRAGHYARNVVIVGPPSATERLRDHFAHGVEAALYRLSGYLSTSGAGTDTRSASPFSAVSLPCLGPVSNLGELLVHRPIHEVVAVSSARGQDWLTQVIEQCDFFRVTLRVVPEELLSWYTKDASTTLRAESRLPEIVLKPRHFDSDALFVKRMFDIVVSAGLLLLLLPLLVLIGVAVKLTTPKLPVFYPWRVIGYKGRPFTGYKFTTMTADADDRKEELMHLNEMSGPVFKIKDDPRITPLGRFLRRFSLNELPQLWSVLKGDMSLVGPRPAYPNELARYELWHKRKLCVQPGITCLWQIRGRNRISNFDDWVHMDFEYIDHWSLWLDCRILLRTAWAVMRGTGS
jgi:exopolysaccharide biosynthesis polyprenyl glycosylphosphotransferase